MDWFSKIEWYRVDLSRPLYDKDILIWARDSPESTSYNVHPAKYREGGTFETCCRKIEAEYVDYWALKTWIEEEEEQLSKNSFTSTIDLQQNPLGWPDNYCKCGVYIRSPETTGPEYCKNCGRSPNFIYPQRITGG